MGFESHWENVQQGLCVDLEVARFLALIAGRLDLRDAIDPASVIKAHDVVTSLAPNVEVLTANFSLDSQHAGLPMFATALVGGW